MTPENRNRAEQIQQRRDARAKWRIISGGIKQQAEWHYGLATHIANQLKQNDIYSREECQRLFVDQEGGLIIQGKKVWPKEWQQQQPYSYWQPHLTTQSVNALRKWLGAPPLSTTKNETLLKAKKFLESHGYTVILPPETTDASH